MDYTDLGVLTVTFAAGTKNGAIVKANLTILNDVIVEGTETVVIVGSIPAGVEASFAIGQDSVTLSICDNDGKCMIALPVGIFDPVHGSKNEQFE